MEIALQNVLINFAKHRVAAKIDPLYLIALLEQERVLNQTECERVKSQPTIEERKTELYLHILPNKYEATVPILAQILENISQTASDYLDDEYQKFKRWRRIISECCDRKEFQEMDVSKVAEKLDDKHLLERFERKRLDAAQNQVQASRITILLEIIANRTPRELQEILQKLEYIDQPSGLASRFIKAEISEKLSHKFEEYKIFHSHDHQWVGHATEVPPPKEPRPPRAEEGRSESETPSSWMQAIEDPETMQLFEDHVEPNDIMPSLISFRILTYNDYELVRAEKTVKDRLIAFQMVMKRRFDGKAWKALMKSLRKNGYQNSVCEKLELILQKYQ